MVITLRYFTEFGNCIPTHNRVDLWRNFSTSLLYFVVRVRWRRKESSSSLSHLLMSFLFTGTHPRWLLSAIISTRHKTQRLQTTPSNSAVCRRN